VENRTDTRPLPLPERLLALFGVAGGVFALDLATKALIFSAVGAEIVKGRVRAERVIEIIPGFFELECVMNPGAFSGWFGGWYWFLILVSAAALVAIAGYVAFGKVDRWLFVVSLALIAGGTAGNLYDRWVYGAVRDFFHFFVRRSGGKPLSWPNFNVADSAICVGVALWILVEFLRGRKQKKAVRE